MNSRYMRRLSQSTLRTGLSCAEERERRLYGRHPHQGAATSCVRPNYVAIAPQLARKGVTRIAVQANPRALFAKAGFEPKLTAGGQ